MCSFFVVSTIIVVIIVVWLAHRDDKVKRNKEEQFRAKLTPWPEWKRFYETYLCCSDNENQIRRIILADFIRSQPCKIPFPIFIEIRQRLFSETEAYDMNRQFEAFIENPFEGKGL